MREEGRGEVSLGEREEGRGKGKRERDETRRWF